MPIKFRTVNDAKTYVEQRWHRDEDRELIHRYYHPQVHQVLVLLESNTQAVEVYVSNGDLTVRIEETPILNSMTPATEIAMEEGITGGLPSNWKSVYCPGNLRRRRVWRPQTVAEHLQRKHEIELLRSLS